MSELDSTTGIVALAAVAIAVLSLLAVGALAFRLRRIRSAQVTVLGEDDHDLVSHAAELDRRIVAEASRLGRSAEALEARVAGLESAMKSVISRSAVIRYDAYDEMTGRQSSSIALLDEDANGVVVSSILHREQARFYAKWVVAGESELDLSPEEREAISEAMAGRHGLEQSEPALQRPEGRAR
ncbi:MAG: DUF4446 family protein [Solirubrobacterales bacterium]